jgi:hypothetical protein
MRSEFSVSGQYRPTFVEVQLTELLVNRETDNRNGSSYMEGDCAAGQLWGHWAFQALKYGMMRQTKS